MRSPKNVFLVTLLVLGLAAVLIAQIQGNHHPEYQIRTVTTMTSKSRNPAEGSTTLSALYVGRKDGSRIIRTTEIYNQRPCVTTNHWDTSTREQVTYSDCVQVRNTVPFTSIPRHVANMPVSSCVTSTTERLQGVETIQGLRVEKFEIDNPTERATLYFAPSLGCMTIRALHYWKGPDGRVESTTFEEPVEVKLDTHDATLFVPPPAVYREALPSERRNAMSRYFSGQEQAAACLRPSNERADKRYNEARKLGNNRGILAALMRRGSQK